MKKNLKNTFALSSGATIILEALVCYAKAHSAADVMYYICRVFSISLPLHVAIPVRILLISLGGYNLISGLKNLVPELYEIIVNYARA